MCGWPLPISARADSQPRNIIGLYKELMLVLREAKGSREKSRRVRGEGRGSR